MSQESPKTPDLKRDYENVKPAELNFYKSDYWATKYFRESVDALNGDIIPESKLFVIDEDELPY